MKYFVLSLFLAPPLCAGKYRPLFDGKSLQGWKVATGSPGAWKVDSGVITGVHGGGAEDPAIAPGQASPAPTPGELFRP